MNPPHDAHATGETVISAGPASGRVNQQIVVSGISIGGSSNDTIPVKLQVTHGSLYMTTTTGISFTTAKTGSSLSFTGNRSNVNAALATLHYAGTVAGSHTLTVSMADQNTIYNPTNGHVYQYVGGGSTWQDAFNAAATSSYGGAPGYLATITSQDENDFIKDRLNGDAWLGATDTAQENTWRWVAGPEAGENFYSGLGASGGAAVDGAYENWASGEPNQAGDEDCMETYIQDGTWNDYPCDNDEVGYVVEYGDDSHTSLAIPSANVAITLTAATFAGGDGSVGAPYQLTDCEQLQSLNQDLEAHYVLNHDIDCTDTPNWNGGQGFVPIGFNNDGMSQPFRGTIEGDGYSIDGLTEIRADDDPDTNHDSDPETNQRDVGLIGYGADMTISNLHLTNAKIKGYQNVGGLVGYMSHSTITNSSVNDGLDESSDTSCEPGYCVWARYGEYGGGLVGYMVAGSIDGGKVGGLVKGSGNIIGGLVGHMEFMASVANSYSTAAIDGGSYIGGAVGEVIAASSLYRVHAIGNVIAKQADEIGKAGWYAGGLVGYAANSAVIEQSYATGDVHADDRYAGGLIGSSIEASITDAYATGAVSSNSYYSGGLIGSSESDVITRVYASGAVSGGNSIGGLIGGMFYGNLNNSFAAGLVSGSFKGGLLAGYNSPILENNYYDVTGTGQTSCTSNEQFDCTQVNANGSQPLYLIDYVNEPFSHSNSRVWSESVWYFDGSNYPVLRMGAQNAASVRPFIDDNDGIAAAVENAAPNAGDGNSDGIQDSTQANVVSFINPVTAKYMTFEVDDVCAITSASNATAQTNSDAQYLYPFGLLDYTVDCGTSGFTATVKIYYHDMTHVNGLVVRKYNGTTHAYATISTALISGANPMQVTYTIKDGSSLDEDGIENGVIVDPVGIGVLTQSNASVLANTGQSPMLYIFAASSLVVTGLIGLVVRNRFLARKFI